MQLGALEIAEDLGGSGLGALARVLDGNNRGIDLSHVSTI